MKMGTITYAMGHLHIACGSEFTRIKVNEESAFRMACWFMERYDAMWYYNGPKGRAI